MGEYAQIETEIMEAIEKILKNHRFVGDRLDRALAEVRYGIFSHGMNPESDLGEIYFGD